MEEILALRHQLHRHPELGNTEHHTAALIEEYLRGLGLETARILDTAVVATLRGGLPGKTVALRADMDALPIGETTGCPFASERPGLMHACGHDVHTAAALGAAKLLAAKRDTLPGAVRFLFQPDEEGDGGAMRMMDAGALEGVSAVFGAHVDPNLAPGTVGVRYGKFYAAADTFTIRVLGKSVHGATPELGIDALGAAARLVCRLNSLPEEHPGDRSVLTIGTLQAGTARNILAGEARMEGILRTLGAENRREMKTALREALAEVAAQTGADIQIDLRESYPGIVNDDGMTAFAEQVATALLGPDRVQRIPQPTMTTEDFGYFLDKIPGCFYHIGVGGDYPLHNPNFLPSDDAVLTAAALHGAVLEAYLTI